MGYPKNLVKLTNSPITMISFEERDLAQFESQGVALNVIEQQIAYFEKGFPFMGITKPATIGDGLRKLSEDESAAYVEAFDQTAAKLQVLKFVPASGAASRMFKALFAFMNEYDGSEQARKTFEADDKNPVKQFISRIKEFAFYEALQDSLPQGTTIESLIEAGEYGTILQYVLTEKGLDYGSLPKGLLFFHKYDEGSRTPLEEHLVEAAHYSKGKGDIARLHFTASPEHEEKFKERLNAVQADLEQKFGVKYEVSFSRQKPATDTIAVDMENQPFRLDSDEILFRPGGHGALIENLNEQDADLVFIKNIDNVVPDRIKEPTYQYKKALAGVLLEAQQKIFDYQEKLEKAGSDESLINEVLDFLEKDLNVLDEGIRVAHLDDKKAYCQKKLDRPIRVCGMVKNEGEPGGGPFWAINNDGSQSLQIVESAQIDMDNDQVKTLVQQASHFNPVDLVCSMRNRKGEKYDLLQFRDPETGFISSKSKDGRELKAQELPGLWNGAMSDWNTLFVEVPIITFNPVKTVNDLLRENHQ